MRKHFLRLAALLIVGITILALGGGTALAADLCVNPGGTGGCYATIQAAIDAAAPGQKVLINPGTYTGGVIVNKAGLALIGQGTLGTIQIVPSSTGSSQQTPSVQARPSTPETPDLRLMGLRPSPQSRQATAAAAAEKFGITVIANNVLIQGLTISGFAGQHDASGIFVGGLFAGDTDHPANAVRILGNRLHDNGNGIYLWQTSNATVSNNTIWRSKDFDGVEGVGILSFAGFGDAEVAEANANGRSGKNNRIISNTLYNNDRLAIFVGACTQVELNCTGPTGLHALVGGTVIKQNVAHHNGADASRGGANPTEAIGWLDAHGGKLSSNSVHTNPYHGIFIYFSDWARLDHNQANGNSTAGAGYAGIRINLTNNVGVSMNTTNSNYWGIAVTRSNTGYFNYNTALSNSRVDLLWDRAGTFSFGPNYCGTASPSRQTWNCQ